jgi:NTP pyrophosphatase (non-canonical NTP hydrolase)
MNIKKILKQLIKFREDRNWGRFHTEAELARALTIEATELNRLYQWGKTARQDSLQEELADVLIYSLYLCEKRGIDPEKAILEKIAKNATRYPVAGSVKEKDWKS